MDARKYAWACVLTQEKTHTIDEREIKLLHPITYMNGLFRGSQLNKTCLTKRHMQSTCLLGNLPIIWTMLM